MKITSTGVVRNSKAMSYDPSRRAPHMGALFFFEFQNHFWLSETQEPSAATLFWEWCQEWLQSIAPKRISGSHVCLAGRPARVAARERVHQIPGKRRHAEMHRSQLLNHVYLSRDADPARVCVLRRDRPHYLHREPPIHGPLLPREAFCSRELWLRPTSSRPQTPDFQSPWPPASGACCCSQACGTR